MGLQLEEGGKLLAATLVKPSVKFAFILAVGGVGLEDISVTGFQFAIDRAFLHCSRANIVRQDS